MQIVIDIDEKYYTDIKKSDHCGNYSVLYALDAIRNGILLPKGHGRLIDADNLLNQFPIWVDNVSSATINVTILKAPTIIEADKEGEDDRD